MENLKSIFWNEENKKIMTILGFEVDEEEADYFYHSDTQCFLSIFDTSIPRLIKQVYEEGVKKGSADTQAKIRTALGII